MRIITKIKNIRLAFKAFKNTVKFGGINTVTVNSINYGEILSGKKIIITGGGSGIGLAMAKKCVECGASVVITGRDERKLQSAVEQINSEKLKFVVWDISNISILEEKLSECRILLGEDVDVLINNAGISPSEFFPNVSEKEWDRVYDVNSKGTFFVSEYMCKYWLDNPDMKKYRKIINIDSQGGFVGATYPYRMSKWDIRGLTEGLGLKMASQGILVNGIAPGVVKTDMQQFSLKQGDNCYCNQNPLGRVSLPEEVAELAVFMISDACNFMVGQTVLIDGGFSLK